jgi:hypothetical protein
VKGLRDLSKVRLLRGAIIQMNDEQHFVLVSPRKRRGADYWDKDDYDVRDSHSKVVGRIMLHPQAPKDQPWF